MTNAETWETVLNRIELSFFSYEQEDHPLIKTDRRNLRTWILFRRHDAFAMVLLLLACTFLPALVGLRFDETGSVLGTPLFAPLLAAFLATVLGCLWSTTSIRRRCLAFLGLGGLVLVGWALLTLEGDWQTNKNEFPVSGFIQGLGSYSAVAVQVTAVVVFSCVTVMASTMVYGWVWMGCRDVPANPSGTWLNRAYVWVVLLLGVGHTLLTQLDQWLQRPCLSGAWWSVPFSVGVAAPVGYVIGRLLWAAPTWFSRLIFCILAVGVAAIIGNHAFLMFDMSFGYLLAAGAVFIVILALFRVRDHLPPDPSVSLWGWGGYAMMFILLFGVACVDANYLHRHPSWDGLVTAFKIRKNEWELAWSKVYARYKEDEFTNGLNLFAAVRGREPLTLDLDQRDPGIPPLKKLLLAGHHPGLTVRSTKNQFSLGLIGEVEMMRSQVLALARLDGAPQTLLATAADVRFVAEQTSDSPRWSRRIYMTSGEMESGSISTFFQQPNLGGPIFFRNQRWRASTEGLLALTRQNESGAHAARLELSPEHIEMIRNGPNNVSCDLLEIVDGTVTERKAAAIKSIFYDLFTANVYVDLDSSDLADMVFLSKKPRRQPGWPSSLRPIQHEKDIFDELSRLNWIMDEAPSRLNVQHVFLPRYTERDLLRVLNLHGLQTLAFDPGWTPWIARWRNKTAPSDELLKAFEASQLKALYFRYDDPLLNTRTSSNQPLRIPSLKHLSIGYDQFLEIRPEQFPNLETIEIRGAVNRLSRSVRGGELGAFANLKKVYLGQLNIGIGPGMRPVAPNATDIRDDLMLIREDLMLANEVGIELLAPDNITSTTPAIFQRHRQRIRDRVALQYGFEVDPQNEELP